MKKEIKKFQLMMFVVLSIFISNVTFGQNASNNSTKQVTIIKPLSVNTEDAKNRLEWSSVNEVHNSYYTLERSNDAINFEILKTIPSTGSTFMQTNYKEYDESPFNGITYYRLKITDDNEKINYSAIVSVENYSGSFKVTSFPNPVSDNLNLTFYSPTEGSANICIYNFAGQMVSNTVQIYSEGNTFLKTDLSELTPGIYTLLVTSNDFKSYRSLTKIIKN